MTAINITTSYPPPSSLSLSLSHDHLLPKPILFFSPCVCLSISRAHGITVCLKVIILWLYSTTLLTWICIIHTNPNRVHLFSFFSFLICWVLSIKFYVLAFFSNKTRFQPMRTDAIQYASSCKRIYYSRIYRGASN